MAGKIELYHFKISKEWPIIFHLELFFKNQKMFFERYRTFSVQYSVTNYDYDCDTQIITWLRNCLRNNCLVLLKGYSWSQILIKVSILEWLCFGPFTPHYLLIRLKCIYSACICEPLIPLAIFLSKLHKTSRFR